MYANSISAGIIVVSIMTVAHAKHIRSNKTTPGHQRLAGSNDRVHTRCKTTRHPAAGESADAARRDMGDAVPIHSIALPTSNQACQHNGADGTEDLVPLTRCEHEVAGDP